MNSIQQIKKTEEAESVSLILSRLMINANSCNWNEESPDCKYTTPNGRVIGIEIARCVNKGDDVLRMQEELYKACKFCEKELRNTGVINKIILVSFNYGLQRMAIKDTDFYKKISNEIITHLQYDRYLNKKGADKELFKQLRNSGKFDYKFVERINVMNGINGQIEVTPVLVYSLSEVTAEAIADCIQKKTEKLKEYKLLPKNKDVSEYWLFITLPWNSFSQIGKLPQTPIETQYSQVFITDQDEVRQIITQSQ